MLFMNKHHKVSIGVRKIHPLVQGNQFCSPQVEYGFSELISTVFSALSAAHEAVGIKNTYSRVTFLHFKNAVVIDSDIFFEVISRKPAFK